MTTLLQNKEVAERIILKSICNSWELPATAGNTVTKDGKMKTASQLRVRTLFNNAKKLTQKNRLGQ